MPDATYTAIVNGAGLATVTIKPPGREDWSVSQVTNEMTTAPGVATCSVRKNGSLISPVVAQADTAAGDPPVALLSVRNDAMTVEWAGCTPGDMGSVYIIYDLVAS